MNLFFKKKSGEIKKPEIKKVTISNLTKELVEQVIGIINTLRGKLCINPENLTQGKTIGFSLVIHFVIKPKTIGIFLKKSYIVV